MTPRSPALSAKSVGSLCAGIGSLAHRATAPFGCGPWGPLGTWAALLAVQVHGRETWKCPRCLVMRGSQLVSGSWASNGQGEVRVWDPETLELRHTLPQPSAVLALLAAEGAVWAGVGKNVVGWEGGA